MANNTLLDLNNHLFLQLEKLGDDDLTPEQLQIEINRSKAINGVAKNIVDNAKTALEAAKFSYTQLPGGKSLPDQFKLKEGQS